MKLPFLSVLLLFATGFLAGNVASHLGFGFPAPEDRAAVTAESEQEGARPKLAQTTESCACDNGAAKTAERCSSQGSTKIAEEARSRSFPPELPPHVADPYFFGPDISDPDLIRQREEAAWDFIRSLEESGIPAEQIAALTAMAESELAAISNFEPDTAIYEGEAAPPPSPEERAEVLVKCLRETGHSEGYIEQMLVDMWHDQIVEPADVLEGMLPPHLQDLDAPTR